MPGSRSLLRRAASRLGRAASTRRDPDGAPSGSTAPEGSLALREGFFDAYPAFFDTSTTSAAPWRLNLRYRAIFGSDPTVFEGARVLDVASHDGRWSLAALRTGASHVTGVEARPELVEHARANLARYGVPDDRHRFVQGDVFEVLARERLEVDVALCLGFLYHTLRWNELFAHLRATGARTVIVDTEVHQPDDGALVRITTEPVDREGNAVPDAYSHGDRVLTGRPTRSALAVLGEAYGYRLTGFADWAGLLRDNPAATQVRDYRTGKRVTARFDAREPGA